jgi:hypothetical protein
MRLILTDDTRIEPLPAWLSGAMWRMSGRLLDMPHF